MRLSQRVLTVPESPIRKLTPLADKAKKTGRRIYHLNIGQPDLPTPEGFLKGVKNFRGEVLSYCPSPGLPELLQVFSDYYRQREIPLAPEELLVTNGGSEALLFSFMAVCDPGDEMLVPEPFYTSYYLIARALGIKLCPVPTFVEDGFHLPAWGEFERRITPRTRALLVTNPGNPTGTVYTREEMNMLGELAKKFNLFLIADEVYREFVYEGEHKSFLEYSTLWDRILLVDSISKRFSACGARIGSLACKNPIIRKQLHKLAETRLAVAMMEQMGAIALAETPSDYFQRANLEYKRRRDITVAGLQSIPGVYCRRPEGAFYILARLPVVDAEDFAAWLLQDFYLDGATVMLAPANGFYLTPGKGKDEVRIAYVLKEEDLVDALAILKEGLRVYNNRSTASSG
ncbi:MAG: pyridoxal phosphate-dependent aminotransferase [Firmicutes bacterium]|nr:pyridoxal phosphate-dependent aminotransferase [Bacillota bacterium]